MHAAPAPTSHMSAPPYKITNGGRSQTRTDKYILNTVKYSKFFWQIRQMTAVGNKQSWEHTRWVPPPTQSGEREGEKGILTSLSAGFLFAESALSLLAVLLPVVVHSCLTPPPHHPDPLPRSPQETLGSWVERGCFDWSSATGLYPDREMKRKPKFIVLSS